MEKQLEKNVLTNKTKINVCDSKIYENIYKVHSKKMFYYLYSKYGDEDKAKDVVQESFAKLWMNCSKIVFEAAKSFLYKVAKNFYLNEIKHQKVVSNFIQNEAHQEFTLESPEFKMEEKEFMVKLNKSIANLNDKQREVFLLNRIEKKTYSEIALSLNLSTKAVEKRMHLALQQLRRTIPNM